MLEVRMPATASPSPMLWQRRLALVALYDRERRRGWDIRLGRLYAWAIALAYGVALVILARTSASERLGAVVVRAIAQLSLIAGGLAALGVARGAAESARELQQLLIQRGFTARERHAGGLSAAVYRVGAVVGLPALALSGLAVLLSTSAQAAADRLILTAAVALYVALLALVLGPLAYWCARLSPTRPRLLLASVLLGPELAARAWSDVPSIPAAFESLLDLLLRLAVPA